MEQRIPSRGATSRLGSRGALAGSDRGADVGASRLRARPGRACPRRRHRDRARRRYDRRVRCPIGRGPWVPGSGARARRCLLPSLGGRSREHRRSGGGAVTPEGGPARRE
ncbi:hypothetical protein SLNWT_6981 [Streptomyces albus]|uniref:Uncharacterized protein n=1 Tax=Streptomyces albus (strain ATCC 21838 / DSM 41398 / FERM P-419 / JCM 4703 / NBRC 107858) TaxID=1081613 RepID=A0A0B5FA69_STRA4|nr:hypothetical protein SLNWT_6981 [Streptomyces albus]